MIACIGVLAAILAALPAPANVPLPAPWEKWRDVRPIVTPEVRATRLVRFALSTGVYGKANADLGDLRVIDDGAREIPFAIDQAVATDVVDWADAPLSEKGFVRGKYTQAVADVGSGGALHDTLRIQTSADEFSAWVEVAASDDERTWRIVRDRAPIFRFSSDGLQGSLTLRFAQTKNRWLRIRVLDGAAEFPIDGADVANDVAKAPELSVVASALLVSTGAPAHQTLIEHDFGIPGTPVSVIRFKTPQAAFRRSVDVSNSDDGDTWNSAGQGSIYCDPQAGTSLDIAFPESRARYWRITVYDRSDQPVTGLSATLLATPRYVAFRAEPGSRYRLLYGNDKADAPEYDFATVTTVDQRRSAALATLGGEMATIAAANAVPWSESHPIVLWIALIFAVVALAWLAIRAMR